MRDKLLEEIGRGGYGTVFMAEQEEPVRCKVALKVINRLGGEWSTDLLVGRTLGLSTELHQPLDYAARFFVEPALRVAQSFSDLYDDARRVAQYRVSYLEAAGTVGVNFTPSLELKGGLVARLGDAGLAIGDEDIPDIRAAIVGPRVDLMWDHLQGVELPRQGFSFFFSGFASREALGADEDYEVLRGDAVVAGTRGRHTFLAWGAAGTSHGGDRISPLDRYSLGGLLNLAGYRPGQLSGVHYGVAAVGYLLRVAPDYDAQRGFYLGIAGEAGGAWETAEEIAFDTIRPGATLMAAVLTPLGPVYVAYAYASGGSLIGNFYVVLGQIQ